MRALLDTHVFLWWITDSPKLSSRAREIISDGGNTLYLSAASGWEMVVKARLGKLELPGNPVAFIFEQLSANDIIELPVRMNHTLHVYSLPPHHRDPFDRLLVSQAQLEILPIISADKQIAEYDVKVIW
ncbi:MAG TPA: PIN domain nuclease [Firmicutes bacterium]|jgi:PIN domain nuclease of toxin-antitoxin system|nr:type II toxin-antitoxin system VapC family toxin [Bacillota bacterium]HAA33827.1 PIN domain nuclease [Bacillota bacterium]